MFDFGECEDNILLECEAVADWWNCSNVSERLATARQAAKRPGISAAY